MGSDNIEYYFFNAQNYFYKGIDKPSILDFNDPAIFFKNKPSWMSDLRTANMYVEHFNRKGRPSNIYVFKTLKSLKLFNLLSTHNISILYNLILQQINNKRLVIQQNIDINIYNESLFNDLDKYITYLLTIEATLGYNVTFDQQLIINKITNFQRNKFYSFNDEQLLKKSGDFFKNS